jgi:uncharacterized protein
MPIPERLQPVLSELKRGLREIYGDRLRAVVLFGSQARGEANEDSDVDVAVVLRDYASPFEEIHRTSELFWDLSFEHDLYLASVPIREEEWLRGDYMLHQSIRREGVLV